MLRCIVLFWGYTLLHVGSAITRMTYKISHSSSICEASQRDPKHQTTFHPISVFQAESWRQRDDTPRAWWASEPRPVALSIITPPIAMMRIIFEYGYHAWIPAFFWAAGCLGRLISSISPDQALRPIPSPNPTPQGRPSSLRGRKYAQGEKYGISYLSVQAIIARDSASSSSYRIRNGAPFHPSLQAAARPGAELPSRQVQWSEDWG